VPANAFSFEEAWKFPEASVDEVWDVLAHGELWPLWWKGVWLEAEKLTPGDKPAVGDRGRAKVRGFLPYEFNFTVEALQLEPGRLIVVKTTGDFDGKCSAALSPSNEGTHVDLDWEVSVDLPIPRFLAPILRPVLVLNHFWTMPRGERGLRQYLAERHVYLDRR
jgi:hypothetical protein